MTTMPKPWPTPRLPQYDPARHDPTPSPATLADLTPAQVLILRRLPRGLADKEIARELGLSPRTVRNQLTRIYAQLGFPGGGSQRVLAAIWYLRQEGQER